MDKFTELLKKYGKTVKDVTFDYEEMSDEELETAFAEAFAKQKDGSGQADPGTKQFDGDDSDSGDDNPDSGDDDSDDDSNDDSDDDSNDDSDDDSNDDDETDESTTGTNDETMPKKRKNNELSKEELFNQLFELSFSEIRAGLNALCSIYRNDNEWCYVEDVYEDYFVMYDWDSNNIWKQSYTKDGDNLSLVGERTQLFAMLLTESEKISVENMRQNYEFICGQLAQYQKIELVNSKDYSAIADKKEFVAVVRDVNNGKNEMTFEELKDSLDSMLLSYAKSGNLNFEAVKDKIKETEEKKSNRKPDRIGLMASGAKGNPKKSRYGNLFKK